MSPNSCSSPFANYTLILPVFNEAKRLLHFQSTFSFLKHVRVVDAGSTDETLSILESWRHPGLDIISIINRESKPRTPEWYQKTLSDLPTKYFLFGNVGHCYTFGLLQELEMISLSRGVDVVHIPNHHYFMGGVNSTFGSYLPRSSPAKIANTLFRPFVPRSGQFLSPDVIDWSQYRLHHELPLKYDLHLKIITSKNVVYSFRDENTESLERKHAGYATTHAKDVLKLLTDKTHSKKMTQLGFLKIYFGHFFHCWLFKGAISQGIPGLISAHYWASYHFSVKVRIWEDLNGFSSENVVACNNSLRSNLSIR